MITVVHIITKLEMGGAQENTLDTCRGLDRSRFRVVLLHGPGGYYDEVARAMDSSCGGPPHTRVEVISGLIRPVQPLFDLGCLAELERSIEKMRRHHESLGHDRRAFVVHTHSSKAGILGRLAAKTARAPVVIHTIHGYGFHEGQAALARSAYIALERLVARATDAFIGVSRANLAEGRALGIIGGEHQVALIRSGFRLSDFREAPSSRSTARRALGLEEEDEVIVSIANMKPQKDPLTLVAAMKILAKKRPKAVLLFAGDGELKGEVDEAVRTAGIADRFRLLGWRTDVPLLLAAADVVALSSIFEGLPRSAVQALAARRPFVGTRVDGIPEVIHEGRNGYLVEPRSPERLADALDRALTSRPVDPEDDARVQEWDVDLMIRKQEDLYERMVERVKG